MRVRDEFINSSYAWDKPVVFGHTPQYGGVMGTSPETTPWQVLNKPEKIGIDLGVCYGGKLAAVQLPERNFCVL
jgi:hypothetical protein